MDTSQNHYTSDRTELYHPVQEATGTIKLVFLIHFCTVHSVTVIRLSMYCGIFTHHTQL